jgi:hypothetical protein
MGQAGDRSGHIAGHGHIYNDQRPGAVADGLFSYQGGLGQGCGNDHICFGNGLRQLV